MLAFNMMVPPKVRANMGGRTLSMDETLKALNLPVLVTHGAADKLILVGDEHRREQGPLWARNSISCAKRKAPAQGVGSRGHRNARPWSGARHSRRGRLTLGICMPSRAGRSDPDFPKALTKENPLPLKPYRLHVTTSFVFPPIRRNVP
jgi:hypothetical protein